MNQNQIVGMPTLPNINTQNEFKDIYSNVEDLQATPMVECEVEPLRSPERGNPSGELMPTNVTMQFPATDKLKSLSSLKKNFSLTLKYRTADDWAALKDKEIRAFYMGLKDIPNDKNEWVKCGVFVTETECFLAGSMLIVEAVSRLEVNTPVEIIYRGKSTNKNSDGSTMRFDITTLE